MKAQYPAAKLSVTNGGFCGSGNPNLPKCFGKEKTRAEVEPGGNDGNSL